MINNAVIGYLGETNANGASKCFILRSSYHFTEGSISQSWENLRTYRYVNCGTNKVLLLLISL